MKFVIAKNGLILSLFAVITSGLIALTYFGTQEKIEHQHQLTLLKILDELVPRNSYTNEMQRDCVLVTSVDYLGSKTAHHIYRATKDDLPVAAVIETTAPNGYSGRIELVVGIKDQSTVTGVRVLNHKETPGLGDKIDLRISDWVLGFTDQTLTTENAKNWSVKKDGGQFDQFTGATITPRAVVGAVKRAVEYYQLNHDAIFSASNECRSQSAIQG
ncbi:electron transport complex subunit RsxG [uncultured Paraglaciecola sp.]|uniref:electron transport complex subunit RsxG n=1 Tax=uncultured Paraglaciecola sp. TaxID=1765024 RepID=UPI0030DA70A3|tara:strand:- start:25525 stop:26172 length:648 start_codon:yes stop_codon:yes gene_type:complete